MKATIKKISLFVIPIALIGFVVWFWLKEESMIETEFKVTDIANQYIEEIDEKINKLSDWENTTLCIDFYVEVKNDIITYSANGKISDSEKTSLLKNLEYVYFPQFISQAFYYFNNSDCDESKMIIIKEEAIKLKESEYLQRGNYISGKLSEIQLILQKHDEVADFINQANYYFNNGDFDYYVSRKYLVTADGYIKFNITNLCVRLKNNLRMMPGKAYTKHLNYIKNKVSMNSGAYKSEIFPGNNWAQKTSAYRDKIYDPINKEIEQFEILNGYGVDSKGTEITSVKTMWNAELQLAMEYFKTIQ